LKSAAGEDYFVRCYTRSEEKFRMIQLRQRRGWVLLAAIAIGIALLCLLIPHDHSGGADGLAILPLLFAGVISPLSLLSPQACEYVGLAPIAPALPSRYQRPPPFRLA
jgi:hypothetical protein